MTPQKTGAEAVRVVLFVYLITIVVLKWVTAAQLDLFGDEAFYWLCARHPALVYADHPMVGAQMVRLGTTLLGNSAIGVRLFFLLCGMAFPLVVYFLARPIVGNSRALFAGGLGLVFPNLGLLGLNAVPDAGLLLWSTLFFLYVVKGTRRAGWAPWILAGCCGALGLLTHYRFVLMPAAALLYLGLSRYRKKYWRGMFVAFTTMSAGLVPTLIYNLQHRFEPLRYYLGVRHQPAVNLSAIFNHLGEQIAIVTPLLYGLVLAVLITFWRKWRRGNDRALLFLVFSALPLVFYLFASPFHIAGVLTVHWPIFGYVPLLVFLPSLLARLVTRGGVAKVLAVTGPALGGVVLMLTLVELAFSPFGIASLHKPFAGWSQVGTATQNHWQQLAEREDLGGIVAADYILGANLSFQMEGRVPVFILGHSKNFEHGRQRQFDAWNMGERQLRELVGRKVLYVTDTKPMLPRAQHNWDNHLDWLFSARNLLGKREVGKGRSPRQFAFYLAVVKPAK